MWGRLCLSMDTLVWAILIYILLWWFFIDEDPCSFWIKTAIWIVQARDNLSLIETRLRIQWVIYLGLLVFNAALVCIWKLVLLEYSFVSVFKAHLLLLEEQFVLLELLLRGQMLDEIFLPHWKPSAASCTGIATFYLVKMLLSFPGRARHHCSRASFFAENRLKFAIYSDATAIETIQICSLLLHLSDKEYVR